MKRFSFVLAVVLIFAIAMPASAGVFRHFFKPVAQGSSYPFRHPKKTLKNSAKATAHVTKKVLY